MDLLFQPKILVILTPFFGLAALIFGAVKAFKIRSEDAGNDSLRRIGGYIREGADAFLEREYLIMGGFVAISSGWLGLFYYTSPDTSPLVSMAFVTGAACSGLAGYLGMKVATMANIRTAEAARTSLNKALRISFNGGTVMGMCVVGLGLMGMGGLLLLFMWMFGVELLFGVVKPEGLTKVLTTLTGFSLGAATVGQFARVGGGIYTKAADVGADLVGKVEKGIPEDDPRNPAVIADNVGDNVGDVAGMGADLFESYTGALIGAMVLGEGLGFEYVVLPLVLAGMGILASIAGTFFVRTTEKGDPQAALNRGTLAAALLTLASSWYVIHRVLTPGLEPGPGGVFTALVVGLLAGTLIGFSTEYYTSASRPPTRELAQDSLTGPSMNAISGLALGMRSTAVPVFILGFSILISHRAAGLYGIAIAALGVLATTGIQLAVDAYGPIVDNAGGIASMAGLPAKVRERTDKLDAVGNTTAAIGKGFAIGSAALTALALLAAFSQRAGITRINLSQPEVISGMFIGAALPFLFSSLAIKAVGIAARDMILEVRRQFREIPGLMTGEGKADYARCVDISTSAAIQRMVKPSLLAILTPVIFGLYSKQMLAGLLAGVMSTGVLMALFMANAGGAWDNAKKLIEAGGLKDARGRPYPKGSDVHVAAVTGDTVGDPLKDTAGPSLNVLIKVMSLVSLTLAPLIK